MTLRPAANCVLDNFRYGDLEYKLREKYNGCRGSVSVSDLYSNFL